MLELKTIAELLKNWLISHYIIILKTKIGRSFNNISWQTLVKILFE